jgi:predicted enzyme related to lactoylglutathione lyase
MGERTSYAPGTFSWAELVTSDAAAGKDFYSGLFGWGYDDMPIGDGQVYSMAVVDGSNLAALYESDQPPHWNCYVTVASADDAVARAREVGANVMSEPFDVLDAGRMAVLADPQGAVVCVWEARGSIGARLVNAPGALTWCDLLTGDPDGAAEFYAALFGWTTMDIPGAGGYRVVRNGERSNGGIMPFAVAGLPADTPAGWMPYFGHEDTGRAIEQAQSAGGRVVHGPMRVPAGSFAAIADPQGAVFAVSSGQYDD